MSIAITIHSIHFSASIFAIFQRTQIVRLVGLRFFGWRRWMVVGRGHSWAATLARVTMKTCERNAQTGPDG